MISVFPATADRWDDLESLFGRKGAYWGCWCMYWRFSNKKYNNSSASDRRIKLKMIVENNQVPGLLAYSNKIPVGWMSISPRDQYERLIKSRTIPKIDEQKTLCIVCFFVHKDFHGRGISRKLIEAAEDFATNQGYNIIEAYPVENKGKQISLEGAYVGILSLFENVGFEKIADTKAKSDKFPRVVVRKFIRDII